MQHDDRLKSQLEWGRKPVIQHAGWLVKHASQQPGINEQVAVHKKSRVASGSSPEGLAIRVDLMLLEPVAAQAAALCPDGHAFVATTGAHPTQAPDRFHQRLAACGAARTRAL